MTKIAGKLCVAAVVAMLAVGCAGTGGMSDEDQVAEVVAAWKAGVEGQDINLATEHYSENYQDAQVSSKEEYIAWLEGIMAQGMLEGAKVSDADAEIVVDGEEATAGPYDVESTAGGWSIDLYLAKEAGGWKIVTVDVY